MKAQAEMLRHVLSILEMDGLAAYFQDQGIQSVRPLLNCTDWSNKELGKERSSPLNHIHCDHISLFRRWYETLPLCQ